MRIVDSIVYSVCSWTCAIAFSIFFRLRTAGVANIPRRGPVLIIANHQSFIDPPAIGCGRARHWNYLARKTLFRNRWFGWLLRRINAVPIDQDGIGIEGIRNITERLARGQVVLVFPEGERTADGDMGRFKAGVALIFRKLDIPVVPAAIVGAYFAWPRWRKYPIPSPAFLPTTERSIGVAFGRPRQSAELRALPREEMMTLLENDVRILMDTADRIRGRPRRRIKPRCGPPTEACESPCTSRR